MKERVINKSPVKKVSVIDVLLQIYLCIIRHHSFLPGHFWKNSRNSSFYMQKIEATRTEEKERRAGERKKKKKAVFPMDSIVLRTEQPNTALCKRNVRPWCFRGPYSPLT